MISKISIGSAQFGLDYGINNDKGKISSQEVALILERAHELGLRNIDTAVAYGDSHKVLGECNLSNWNITTKISKIRSEFNIPDTIYSEVSRSLDILNIESISAVLVHDANQLIDIDIGSKIFDFANNNAATYGVFVVIFSIFSGFIAATLFRRSK